VVLYVHCDRVEPSIRSARKKGGKPVRVKIGEGYEVNPRIVEKVKRAGGSL
jgi:hypothetical protein